MNYIMYAPPLHAIAHLLDHLYEDARHDYFAVEPEDRPFEHIFESATEVEQWLRPFNGDRAATPDPKHEQLRLFD